MKTCDPIAHFIPILFIETETLKTVTIYGDAGRRDTGFLQREHSFWTPRSAFLTKNIAKNWYAK